MQPQVVHLAPGTVIAGKFRVLRLLGMGGMGAVYEIEHELTKHRRALKLLHAQFRAYPAVIARFLREASAAGRIGNAHIVETFDAGQLESGEPYIVMEHLEGETLADRLGRENVLPVDLVADLVEQTCLGIQAAHERGIVHRDLKPENIFIQRRDDKPFVRILDFGVSKFDAALTGGLGITSDGSTVGTPFYMPPEQIRGEKNVDARADVYALGVILYECVTGRRPYEAETLPHLAVLIHEGNAPPIETLRPDLPAAFAAVVSQAMASEPDARFASARALAEALAPFARQTIDVPVTIESVSPGRPVVPSGEVGALASDRTMMAPSSAPPVARRRKTALLLIFAGSLLLALALAWQFGRARTAEQRPRFESTALPPAVAAPPSMAPAPSMPSAAPASVSETARTPAPTSPTKGPAPSAAKPPPPRPSPHDVTHAPSRAEQKGLANENPFR